MKYFVLLTCFSLCFFPSLISQTTNSPLTEVDESTLIGAGEIAERIITPDEYKTLHLDVEKLRLILDSAPQEDATGTDRSAPFEVIMADGKTEAFHLVEYSMMEPALAAQFPSFKTYHGYGINDPSRRIRLDWTSEGLNAMLLLPEGLAFLRPYTNGETEYYLSYYEHQLPVNTEPFECGTVDEKLIEPRNTDSAAPAGDCQLRTYRLAVAVTGEYATSTLGASSAGTAADDAIVTAHIVTSINQINGWYERDITARLLLIANLTDIFYYNGANDPYTNNNTDALLDQNTTNLNATIGSGSFDIGHVLGNAGGSSGVATLNSLCGSSKARGVTRASAGGITQPRFLKVWAHEMGHQFGAGHTQGEDCQRALSSAMEPGAGTTLMSYVTSNCINQIQNVPDYYFHAISIQQMSSRMFSTNCAAFLPNTNAAPTVFAGADVTVPHSTPLFLQATASDADNDPLTFTWEQYNNDIAEVIPPEPTNTLGPSFRSLPPSNESGRYLPNLAAVINGTTPTWEVLPSVARTMDFRVTVRDNSTNSMSCTDEDNIRITTVASGPFMVTSPTTSGVIWFEGQTHTVSWDVAGTNAAPVACANVDILLSYDGGFTYPVTLANSVANDGSENVVVPIGISTTARVQVRCSNNIFYNISASDFEIQVSSGPSYLLNLPNPFSSVCAGDAASNIAVTTAAIGGFSGNVSLSASNLPGSTTVAFTNPVITAGASTTFEINNTAGLAEGNYTITITGTSGSIVRNFNHVLTIKAPAGLTTLDFPADNAVDIELIPSLSWLPKSNAIAYNVQVSADPNFSSLAVNETTSTSAYSFDTALDRLTDYYWRVKTTTNCGDTPWSSTRQFTTADCVASYIQNTPVFITENGTPVINSVISITNSGTVDGLVVSNIRGTHTYVGDLSVELIGPGGTPTVLLWDQYCGSFDNFNLSLSDDATIPVANAPCSPFGQGGTFSPEEPLSAFNGIPVTGDWTLRVNDNANLDGGELTSWRLDFCSLVALPVDLLSFDVFAKENAIQLEWKTANEYENAGFEIERRSETEKEFSAIGEVTATDEIQQVNNYTYLDKEVRPGTRYYYRLRQNDLDGQFEYSPIRTAKMEGIELGLQVYPSPVSGELHGRLHIPSGEVQLRLYDLNGRVVKEQIIADNQFVMDMTGLSAGMYVLRARHAGGEESIKLVVE